MSDPAQAVGSHCKVNEERAGKGQRGAQPAGPSASLPALVPRPVVAGPVPPPTSSGPEEVHWLQGAGRC